MPHNTNILVPKNILKKHFKFLIILQRNKINQKYLTPIRNLHNSHPQLLILGRRTSVLRIETQIFGLG